MRINFKKIRERLGNYDNIFMAVSGGLDSMVMLDVIDRCLGFEKSLYCCYFEHNKERDERGERDFIRNTLITKYPKTRMFNSYLDHEKMDPMESMESEMRKQRYEFLDAVVNKNGLDSSILLTAHHLDDNIETVLFNLLTNRKIGGVNENLFFCTTQVHRPLLDYAKADLMTYAQNFGVTWMEDPTNLDSNYCDRNFIRQQLLPSIVRKFGSQSHLLRLLK